MDMYVPEMEEFSISVFITFYSFVEILHNSSTLECNPYSNIP